MIWSKTVLFRSRLEIFIDSGQNQSTFAAGQRSEIRSSYRGVLVGIGMINEYISGRLWSVCEVVVVHYVDAVVAVTDACTVVCVACVYVKRG